MHTIVIKSFRAIKDHIIVSDMNFSERITSGGLIVPNDDFKNRGIRPRWAKVFAVGPECEDINVGQWICIEHGRWTKGAKIQVDGQEELVIRRVDNKDILLISDEKPTDDTIAA